MTAPASRCRRRPPGTLLLGIASAAAEELAPVALLALLKHPLVGGEGDERLDVARGGARARHQAARSAARRPGSRAGRAFRRRRVAMAGACGRGLRAIDGLLRNAGVACAVRAIACPMRRRPRRRRGLARARRAHGGGTARRTAGVRGCARLLVVSAEDAVPLLRQLLDAQAVRPPYGGHPRIFIWGLLEARLQRADLVVLGGLNEGVWPALAGARSVAAAEGSRDARDADARQPHRACRARFRERARRAGSADHARAARRQVADRRLALPAAARRDQRRPAARHRALERLTRALDDPGPPQPGGSAGAVAAGGAAAGPDLGHCSRPAQGRSVRFLCAGDPQAAERSIRSTPTIPRGGRGPPSTRCSRNGCSRTIATPTSCRPRAERLLAGRGDPPDAARACGRRGCSRRSTGSRSWSARTRPTGRRPLAAEVTGEAALAGVTVHGRADRIDRLADGGLAIIDYKTGAAADAEGGRRGLRAAARPARPDRPRRRVRGRDQAIPRRSNIGRSPDIAASSAG